MCNKEEKPEDKETKKQRKGTFENINAFFEGKEIVLNAFKSGLFLLSTNY